MALVGMWQLPSLPYWANLRNSQNVFQQHKQEKPQTFFDRATSFKWEFVYRAARKAKGRAFFSVFPLNNCRANFRK